MTAPTTGAVYHNLTVVFHDHWPGTRVNLSFTVNDTLVVVHLLRQKSFSPTGFNIRFKNLNIRLENPFKIAEDWKFPRFVNCEQKFLPRLCVRSWVMILWNYDLDRLTFTGTSLCTDVLHTQYSLSTRREFPNLYMTVRPLLLQLDYPRALHGP